MHGQTDIARALLQKCPTLTRTSFTCENLRDLAGFGHLDTLKFLDRQKIVEISVDENIYTDFDMLEAACKGGHWCVVEWLLEAKKLVKKLMYDDMSYYLDSSCKSGNYKLVNWFIDYMENHNFVLEDYKLERCIEKIAMNGDRYVWMTLWDNYLEKYISPISDLNEKIRHIIHLDTKSLAYACCNKNNKSLAKMMVEKFPLGLRLDTAYIYYNAEIVNDVLGPAYDHGCFEMIKWLYDRLQLSKHINKVNKTNLILKISDIDDEEKRQTIYGWTINAFKIQRKELDTTELLSEISSKCGVSNFKTAKWMIETFDIQLSDFRKYENDVMWVACGRPHNMEFVQCIVEHIRFTWSDVVLGSSNQKPWLDYCVRKRCWDVLEYLIRRFNICHEDFLLGENAELSFNIPQELHILLSLNSIVRSN